MNSSDIGTQAEISGNKEIYELNQPVSYELKIKADIPEYMGDGEVIIIDYLPYHIDPDKSDLDDGEYDSIRNTIKWVEDISKRDNAELVIEHNIKVKYIDLNYADEMITNKITAKVAIYDDDIEDEASAEINTLISVKNTITIR